MTKYVTTCTWNQVPHLSEQAKKELLNSTPPYLRDARSKGRPALGAGAIYPVQESQIVVPRFEIPPSWKRGFGLDVGWNVTAGVWGAKDLDSQVVYLYSEHHGEKMEPSLHTAAIRQRGAWMTGVIDPASRGRSQSDGSQLLQSYTDLGIQIEAAVNAVSTGLDTVWQALSGGELKVFDTLVKWLAEFRLYRRDEKGNIVKKNDHLMDATRYFWMSGRDLMKAPPSKKDAKRPYSPSGSNWMA